MLTLYAVVALVTFLYLRVCDASVQLRTAVLLSLLWPLILAVLCAGLLVAFVLGVADGGD